MTNYERAHAIADEIVSCRRAIHGFAEVGFDMPNTLNFVKEKLTEYGYENIQEMGGGLVITVGTGDKTFLLRGDMDALPMKELSGVDFAATNGQCHACGHDMHAAMLLGAARMLKEMEEELPGTVKLMFQPAEELLSGAKAMVAAGVLENPKVDAAMALHVTTGYPTGTLISRNGSYMASSNNFRMTIHGKATHGAMPERGIDPVYIGAQIVIGAQELMSRELPFTKSATLTMGHFSAGSVPNSIPDTALIEGTMRTVDPDTQAHLAKRLPEVANCIAQTYRGSVDFEYISDAPVLVVNDAVYEDVCRYINNLDPEKISLVYLKSPATASEDFAEVASRVPTCYVNIGAKDVEAKEVYPCHHPKVVFDEKALPIGTAVMVEAAVNWLAEHQ